LRSFLACVFAGSAASRAHEGPSAKLDSSPVSDLFSGVLTARIVDEGLGNDKHPVVSICRPWMGIQNADHAACRALVRG
jgi:hypothetical protein